MGSWFLAKKQDSQQTQPMTALRVQSAVEGKARPRLWGRNRISGNLIWYGDFTAHPVSNPQQGGGKGAAPTGGGGKGQQGSTDYTYSVSCMIGLCEGPITGINAAWNNKAIGTVDGFGFEVFKGEYSQVAWGYLTSRHPDQALNYRGLAYVAQASIDLGGSTELMNYSFEVTGAIAHATPNAPDANPRDVVVDYLTNPYCGVPAWPANRLASMDQYATYALATGLLVSPVLTDQREASAFLADLLTATNASARWSSGLLDIIPWGDQPVTGNGVTYTPDVTPLYDLTNDDFLPGANDGQPILSKRRAPNERLNAFTLEFLDRNDNYDPAVVDDKDQASIQQYGLRPSEVRQAHFFCLEEAARLSAHLQLGREQIPNTYEFTLPPRFILVDVEDVLTITRPELVLFRQLVRVTEITENADGSLSFVAEELNGTAGAPRYGTQATSGYTPNTNVDPGGINEPIIFEPTDQLGAVNSPLGGGLQVWAAISGVNTTLWGGCNVYGSYDGVTYSHLGRVVGPARMGVTTTELPVFSDNPAGPNVDNVNSLGVNLSVSAGALLSGTAEDALALNTACYVGGEIVAYRDALLTGASTYTLSYLVRGAYGTEDSMEAAPKPAGTPFARLDQGIFKMPFDKTRIGATVSLKFQSFNIWGGGLQDISDLPVYQYTLTGSALASPLPNVQNLRYAFNDGFQELSWDEIVDFRQGIRYKIFEGETYEGAQQRGDVAHPPFKFLGGGNYWIVGYCQPAPGLIVYSEDAVTLAVTGNMLVSSIVMTSDQQADGWPGTFSNTGKEGVDPNAVIRLSGAGDILTDPDVLTNPDILAGGGILPSGYYEIDAASIIDAGHIADIYLNVAWQTVGSPVGDDVLSNNDILNTPDILGSSSTQFVDGWIEVATADSLDSDLYLSGDLYSAADLYAGAVTWSDWRRYVPGVYRTRLIKLRFVLSTVNPATIAYGLKFSFTASVEPRIDHYQNLSVGTGGVTVTFEPDDSSIAAPFNGGPLLGGAGNNPLPFYSISWPNLAGDVLVIDALSLSAMTFHFENGGSPVARTGVNLIVEGY